MQTESQLLLEPFISDCDAAKTQVIKLKRNQIGNKGTKRLSWKNLGPSVYFEVGDIQINYKNTFVFASSIDVHILVQDQITSLMNFFAKKQRSFVYCSSSHPSYSLEIHRQQQLTNPKKNWKTEELLQDVIIKKQFE